MLNYLVVITSEFWVKLLFGQKTVIVTIFWPPNINLKPNLCMEPNNNILSSLVHYNDKLTT